MTAPEGGLSTANPPSHREVRVLSWLHLHVRDACL
ncbi:hypothetical protein ALP44_200183 [Pseudomonas syringae pv. theae]|uniref:Uncharacterized protein n=1 Tax=Pseudomonas syringae pv. theae TaxID=103985 RepID=A0A3M5MBR0_PSESX|nr:hypothetical protein ALP44_200183 [Pseudomonas syringae pv. theae]